MNATHPEITADPPLLVDEMALVQALAANDRAAWRALQQRYDPLILRCITTVTQRFAAVSRDDVREIRGQFFLSLLANDRAKLHAFDPARGTRFSSYLGTLAIHCAYDWLRNLRREPPREPLGEGAEPPSALPDPFEAAAQRERARLAASIFEALSERDRFFADLYFGDGMQPREIAHCMKISVKTVYSKKHKIQAKLQELAGLRRCQPAA